ncbi:MAG TPA: GNAT family N-acetyltransferase [Oligoflexus sp.]|uniref:GNAT family N-acetyltransferase n=1 Tax=Oligoflexus sp. TaxID=1971216 RepID=UPI002D666C51|nr:GNAT family N-acetyltransferase [Oligoflexus sp.]HYX35247.1 GNAT family N-acetyltransferase [Oligoflexus sp.]
MPRLESPRLILDEVTAHDVEAIHRYASDPEVVRYQTWGPNTLLQTEEFVQQVLRWQHDKPRRFIVLAIRKKNQPRMLGAVSLEIDDQLPSAAFGFSLARDAWGQGFATEAGQTLIMHIEERMPLTRLTASCDRRNIASQSVLRKCGFKSIGLIHQHMMLRDGLRDTLLFELPLRAAAASP